MKKALSFLAVAGLVATFVACNNTPKQPEEPVAPVTEEAVAPTTEEAAPVAEEAPAAAETPAQPAK